MGKESNPQRFAAKRDEIEMLGKVTETEDRTTPEQKARNAEHDRRLKEIFAED